MNDKYPSREVAEELLREAESCNPGPWGAHSRVVAMCAEKIAKACPGMNPEKAYVVGLLHDIGRKFGVKHFGHIYDGYTYMDAMGYGAAARICLSHSFCIQRIDDYIGNFDVTKEQQEVVEDALYSLTFDDYDLLIQLCDSIGAAEGIVSMEERMGDVKRRYGSYPQDKWDRNLELRSIFEQKSGRDLYDILKSE
ncbi:MAG: HDOD domain-containing protein [Lachnospiraceae bacterium]|nr:HDOD domain-containing protein [Lachnospiraceae bacterium]